MQYDAIYDLPAAGRLSIWVGFNIFHYVHVVLGTGLGRQNAMERRSALRYGEFHAKSRFFIFPGIFLVGIRSQLG